MKILRASIPGVLLIQPSKHADHRGFFSEVFRNDMLKDHGVDLEWIQDNHSFSAKRGVVRGLHFQVPPFAQAKIARVVRGAVLDVAVDIRSGSPTYGEHVAAILSADNWMQMFVPTGFAHGICSLTPDTELIYKVTAPHVPEHEGGVLWNDPDLGIGWPASVDEATLSGRDMHWPLLRDFTTPF